MGDNRVPHSKRPDTKGFTIDRTFCLPVYRIKLMLIIDTVLKKSSKQSLRQKEEKPSNMTANKSKNTAKL